MHSPTRDRARPRHGEPTHVSNAADVSEFDISTLPCVDDFPLLPERPDVPTRARTRTRGRPRQDAPASGRPADFAAMMEEVRKFHESGGLAAARAEMDAIAQEFWRRGGKAVNTAETRRLLAEITGRRKLPPRGG